MTEYMVILVLFYPLKNQTDFGGRTIGFVMI